MMQQIISPHHQLLFSSGKSLDACAKKQHQMMQQILSHHQLLFSSGKSLGACAKTLNDTADNLSSPAALQLR
jgi:hypothetical protein